MAARPGARLLLALCLTLFFTVIAAQKISNKRICADKGCLKTISEAKAIKSYWNDDSRFLSFAENDVIQVKSKNAGRVPYLWSGQINERVGYFPMSHVRETEVFVKRPEHLVNTNEEGEKPDELSSTEAEPEVDETEIEEDDPTAGKTEFKKEPIHSPFDAERDETEIDEEEEVAPQSSDTEQDFNSKEESITQHADEIMHMYHQLNDDLQKSNENIKGTAENEPITDKPRHQPVTDMPHSVHVTDKPHYEHVTDKQHYESVTDKSLYDSVTDKPHFERVTDTLQSESVTDKPRFGSVTDKPHFERVTDTHHYESVTDKPATDKPHFEHVTNTLHYESITDKPLYDSVTDKPHFGSVTDKPQNEMRSSIPERNPSYTETTHQSALPRDPMQTPPSDVLRQAHQTHQSHPTRLPDDDSASRRIEATPSATSFATPSAGYTVFDGTTLFDGTGPGGSDTPQTVETSLTDQAVAATSSNININPTASSFKLNGSHFKSKTMDPQLEAQERHREENRKVVDTVSSIGKPQTLSVTQEPPSPTAEGTNFMKTFDVYLKAILKMCPSIIENFLKEEPLGIPPTMLLLYILLGFLFSFFFFIITCCSFSSPKPRTDPVIIIRNLEERLFITTKEKENLEDDLLAMKENISSLKEKVELQRTSTGSAESDLQRQKLRNDELKEVNYTLNEQLARLRTDYEDLVASGTEKEKRLELLEEENMKIADEYRLLGEERLQLSQVFADAEVEKGRLGSRVELLEDQVRHLETRKAQLLEEADQWTEKHQELTINWEQSLADYNQMRETLDFKENELAQMQACFLELKAFEDDEEEDRASVDEGSGSGVAAKIQAMLDVSNVRAMLAAAEEEKTNLLQSRKIEIECRLELEDQIEKLKRDLETLQSDKAKASRMKDEAQTKLNVLTTYFKEKEVEFQRELGEHEIRKKENINKLGTAEERAKNIEGELESYRSQIEDLKQEITKAERDFRAQIAANEKKAHENWLATRAAERELKEARMECTMLRQKLTELERRPMPGSIIRPLPTRGSGHIDMVNGPPPQLLPYPLGDHPPVRKDLLPPTRDEQSKPPVKSPSPQFRPSPRPSNPNFRPPLQMKKRGPPPPPMDGRDPFYNWQMGPPPRIPFGNRPPPPLPPSKHNPPHGPPFGNHPPPPPHMMAPQQHRHPPPDFPPYPDKPPTTKQHSQV